MNNPDKLDMIVDALKSASDYKVVALWEECAEAGGYIRIFQNGVAFFEDLFSGCDIGEVMKRVFFGRFNTSDSYIYFNGYNNLVTFNHHYDEDSPIDYEMLAEYIFEAYFLNEIEEKLGIKLCDIEINNEED